MGLRDLLDDFTAWRAYAYVVTCIAVIELIIIAALITG